MQLNWSALLQHLSGAIMAKFAVYADKRQQYFSIKPPLPFIYVLSRANYREQRKSFPVKSQSELKKLLALRYGDKSLFFIGDWQQHQREVLIIDLHDSANEMPVAGIVIPETLFLDQLVKPGLVIIERDGPNLYAGKASENTGVITSLAVGAIASAEQARLSMGISSEFNQQQWPADIYLNILRQNLFSVPLKYLLPQLGKALKAKLGEINLKTIVPVSIAVFAAYLFFTQWYIQFAQNKQQQWLAEQKPAINTSLQQRALLAEELEKIQQLKQALVSPEFFYAAWLVMADFTDNGYEFQRLTGTKDVVEIRGEVASATAMLQWLSAHPQVTKVESVAPVRRTQSGESYSVRFWVKPYSNVSENTDHG